MEKAFAVMGVAVSLWAIEPIVTPQWVNEHTQNTNLRIVEVSEGDTYALEHLPNAVHTSIDKWRFDNGTFFSVRPIKEIEAEISRLGIDATTDVVLYAPIHDPKDLLKTSYIYWALNYHGVKNVALLDGGLPTGKNSTLPTTQEEPTITPTVFKATLDPTKIADLSYVRHHLGLIPMIDARPSDKYLGITPTPTVKRDGHIPQAMSYPWDYSVDKAYRLKNPKMLSNVFKEGYKLNKNQEVIVYCTGGLETSFNYFVLSGVLGYKKVRLYDASMKEWGNREDTPIRRYRYEMR